MERTTQIVPVRLDNEKVIQVEVTSLGGEEDIAVFDHFPSFREVTSSIEEVSKAIANAIEKVKPQKASVEFGLKVALQEGNLTALLAQGSGTTSIKVTLEWDGSE